MYSNPEGHYSFARIRDKATLENWHSMGLDANTKFADPLFVDRENHDYRLKPVHQLWHWDFSRSTPARSA